MAEANEGKILSIINADLPTVTDDLAELYHIFGVPFLWTIIFALIAVLFSWKIAGITFGVCLLTLIAVFGLGGVTVGIKEEEASFCDERLKLMSDFVEGIRTIKAFGWEEKCETKLACIRKN